MKQHGFTIIETVLGIALLSAVFLGLSVLLSSAARDSVEAEVMTTATLLSRQMMEETLVKDFSQISAVSQTVFSGSLSDYTYEVTVDYVESADLTSVSISATDYKRVTITITRTGWPSTYSLMGLKTDV